MASFKNLTFGLSTFLLAPSVPVFAEQVIEKGERAEVNWSSLEVRYYGEAAPAEEEKDSFKSTERRAWQDGIAAIDETLKLLSTGRIGMHVSAPRGAATLGGSRTTSRSTTYFGDGKVRVYLQTPLQQVVNSALGEVSFRQADAAAIQKADAYTGVIIQLTQKVSPMAVYKLTDVAGEKLFGLEDMTEAGF